MNDNSPTWSIAACALALGGSVGCGSDDPAQPAALDLELFQDLNINTPAMLLEGVDNVVVVVDSPDGLYPKGSEMSKGALQVKDADKNPDDLELVITAGLVNGRLPRIRLERGGLPDLPLDFRVLGLSTSGQSGASFAVGGVGGVHFADAVQSLPIPFNIRPELLPPRVMDVVPGDGDSMPSCDIEIIVVIFSKPIDPATLAGGIELTPGGKVTNILPDATGLVAQLSPPKPLSAGFSLTISTTVKDTSGNALDHSPTIDGAQPYEAQHEMPCPASQLTPILCGAPVPPPPPATGYCPGGLSCVDNVCVPPAGCAATSCAPGHVCDPNTGFCAVDCRAYGVSDVCPVGTESCDSASGLCK